MKRRLLIIVLALILAAVGTSGVLAYVRGANARAIAGMKAVSVLVAQKKIPAGTTAAAALRGGMLASQTLPASSVSAEALSSIPANLSSQVLSADLQPGQLLLRPMLVTPAQTTSGLAIPPGMMAVTLSFCLPEDVAGAVQSGSEVAVFDTVGSNTGSPISAEPGCAGAHTQVGGNIKTRVVLQRVMVLSVGASSAGGQPSTSTSTSTTSAVSGNSSSSTTSSSQGSLVTLAVTQAQAEQLIQMTVTGLPYLALLTTSSHTASDAGHLLATAPPPPTPSPIVTFPLVTPSTAPTTPVTPPSPAPSPAPSPTTHKRK